jgi:CRISPR/Cas system-associated exonuclease Cas4 (RecB family)
MAREIVKNLKFKKQQGVFDPNKFAEQLNEAYLGLKRPNGFMQKKSFSPSSVGYGYGNCPRYWYMAFNGAEFIDDNDAQAVANMQYGTEAHARLQKLISDFPEYRDQEVEILNDYPPVRGFADLVMDYGTDVIGEIKTAKQEVWDQRQVTMASSPNHMLQLLMYMHIKKFDEGFFVYENKNTQEILVIPITMNDRNKKIIDELFIWLREVWDNYKDGDLPMRPFTKTSSSCKYCSLKKACWNKEAEFGTVQIEPYEVPKV